MERRAGRSLGVTLIAILLAVNGVMTLIGSFTTLGMGTGGTLGTIIGVLFGAALLYLAYGLWTLQSWAWATTLLLQGLNALVAVIVIFTSPGAIGAWISLLLAAVIIYYLLRPDVRDDFGRRRVGV